MVSYRSDKRRPKSWSGEPPYPEKPDFGESGYLEYLDTQIKPKLSLKWLKLPFRGIAPPELISSGTAAMRPVSGRILVQW